jgi:hypothetical protein
LMPECEARPAGGEAGGFMLDEASVELPVRVLPHIQLIPRRDGDMLQPLGGVIPYKMGYPASAAPCGL